MIAIFDWFILQLWLTTMHRPTRQPLAPWTQDELARGWFAGLGDEDLFAVGDSFDQFRKLRFRFMKIDGGHIPS